MWSSSLDLEPTLWCFYTPNTYPQLDKIWFILNETWNKAENHGKFDVNLEIIIPINWRPWPWHVIPHSFYHRPLGEPSPCICTNREARSEISLEKTGSAQTLRNYTDNTEFCTCSGQSEIGQAHTSLGRQMSCINFTPKKSFEIRFADGPDPIMKWEGAEYPPLRDCSLDNLVQVWWKRSRRFGVTTGCWSANQSPAFLLFINIDLYHNQSSHGALFDMSGPGNQTTKTFDPLQMCWIHTEITSTWFKETHRVYSISEIKSTTHSWPRWHWTTQRRSI